jgi:hypothetical protein
MSKFFKDKDPTFKDYLAQVGLRTLGYDPGEPDNWWGSNTESAYQRFYKDKVAELGKSSAPQNTASSESKVTTIKGKASSFADPADIAAFKKCKAQGKSDQECFKVGDNGIGYTGLDTTRLDIPYVAVQPDYMIERWGKAEAAAGKKVLVTINGVTKECVVGDRMPWVKNTKNGAVIDLAPGAQKLFNLKPPFMVDAEWRWA